MKGSVNLSSFFTKSFNKDEPQKGLSDLNATFFAWLLSQGYSECNSRLYIDSVSEISTYAISARKIKVPILELKLASEIKKALNNLMGDKVFKIRNKQAGNKYTTAFNLLLRFLKSADVISTSIIEFENTAAKTDELRITDYVSKTPLQASEELQTIVGATIIDNEVAFYNWLTQHKNLAPITAKSYVCCINLVGTIVKLEKRLFTITSYEKLLKVKNDLFTNPVFLEKNESCHNSYTAAVNNYYKFLLSSNSDNIVTCLGPIVDSEIKNRSLKPTEEYLDTSNPIFTDCELAAKVILDEFFQSGIKVSSNIQLKKFLIHFSSVYPDISLSNELDEIKSIIAKVTIDCSESLYITPNNITDEPQIIFDIIDFIISTFKSGKKIIYLENIYNHYKERIIDTNIYNKDILMCLIKHFLKDDVVYKSNAILVDNDVNLNINDEVLEVLYSSDVPLSKQEVYTSLSNILPNKIEQILKSDKRSVYIARNIYWHIDKFEVTDDDKIMLEDIIRFEIQDGFISVKKLLDVLNSNMTDFVQKNNITNHVTLRDILKYYFADKFGFQYTFIGKYGEEMSGIIATKKHFSHRDSFTLDELIQFVEDSDLPHHFELFIGELCSVFVRINEQNFIRKDAFSFDTQLLANIRETIENHLMNGFIAFSQIKNFSIFPYIYYSWNLFLLESIITNFCPEYEIVRFSRSVTKCTGIIVDKRKGAMSFDDILIEVLAARDKAIYIANSTDALNYLFKNEYIAQRRYKNIDFVLSAAKKKTNKRG